MTKKIPAWTGITALGLLAVALSAPASAADIYRRDTAPSMKAQPALTDPAIWQGSYIGLHAGGAWANLDVKNLDDATKLSNDPTGFFGGATLGFNIQRGALVFGIEGDVGGMDLSQTKTVNGVESKIDSGVYGDITGRLGVAAGQALIYGKGGFALYDGPAKVAVSNDTDTFTGWTVGGGVEYAIRPDWTAKVEYQYFDFGDETVTAGTVKYKNELTANTVKFGLNYQLSRGYDSLK